MAHFELQMAKQYLRGRCLMVSTDQADPSCFYFRISWILMGWLWFNFFCLLHLVQGLRSLQNWLLQKLSTKNLDSSLKNRYYSALIFQEREFFDHWKYIFKTSWPQKISIFKILSSTIITLNLIIKKRPLTFSKLKK